MFRSARLPLLLLLLSLDRPTAAQTFERVPALREQLEHERALRSEFEAALTGSPDAARRYLPLVAGRPWLGEMDFRESCTLAGAVAEDAPAAALATRLVLAAGLHNPSLALRESSQYLALAAGRRLFRRFVQAAPDEAMAIAAGTTPSARAFHDLLTADGSPELAVLARLAADASLDLPSRGRAAVLSGRVARGALSLEAALRIARDTPKFFATVLDLRTNPDTADPAPLERALENESLLLCRAAQESPQRTLAADLSGFRDRDLYALLALGRAEATPAVFAAVFDRLLLPRWKAQSPKGASLLAFLDRTKNWELRDFVAGAIAGHRFDALLSLAGGSLVDRLARGIDRQSDPLHEAMRLAEVIDASAGTRFVADFAAIVAQEFARCQQAGDTRGATLYGLLAARLSLDSIAAPYLPFFRSSETLDTALLYGPANDCVERHFFYDDEDGIRSFESFLKTYQRDPAWEIEDHGEYVHLTGHGPEGRRIEIFANVPIDGHLPANRAREGEAQRRQQAIAAALQARSLSPAVIVHRGHSFWVEKTLTYLTRPARLVILGSCGGATEIYRVIEASHDAQVIATRGVGETEINDAILKAVNDRILHGDRIIEWDTFWRELKNRWGNSALFRDYLAPNQDPGAVFLRAYRRLLDASN